MTPHLREELDRLADTQPTFRPDPTLWDRGRRARRRSRVVAGAAALAMVAIVGGVGVTGLAPDDVAPADAEVPEGAIPSRIEALPASATRMGQDALDAGTASVAYLSPGKGLVLVSATDGSYRHTDVPHRAEGGPVRLSPDGTRLAYVYAHAAPGQTGSTESGVAIVRLSDGDIVQVPAAGPADMVPAQVTGLSWSADSTWVAWSGRRVRSWAWGEEPVLRRDAGTGMVGAIEVARTAESPFQGQSTMQVPAGSVAGVAGPYGYVTFASAEKAGTFVAEPGGGGGGGSHGPWTGDPSVLADIGEAASSSPTDALMAVGLASAAPAAVFVTDEGDVLERHLDESLYPSGARVTPLGWAEDSLVVAQVDAPAGSVAEGAHLALFTSPDRPESEWTYRILVRGVPASVSELSVAVDLIPELDGTSSQALTRDFPPPEWGTPWRERLPYVLGALMALLAGLAYIRMLRHQA